MESRGRRRHIFVALVLLTVLLSLPRTAYASPSFVAFEKVPLGPVDAETAAGAPTAQYYGFHFPPRLGRPSPYIVLVPGCLGLVANAKATLFAYAQRLVREGYGALVIDIFRGTGFTQTCDQSGGPSRAGAALSALRFVRSTGYASGRFGIVGQGQGGTAAGRLSSEEVRVQTQAGAIAGWFDAAVAFYPDCRAGPLAVPYLILTGGKDEREPAAGCLRWYRDGDVRNLELTFYPNAARGLDLFDLRPGREFNFHIIKRESAARDALRRMIDFFDRHLW